MHNHPRIDCAWNSCSCPPTPPIAVFVCAVLRADPKKNPPASAQAMAQRPRQLRRADDDTHGQQHDMLESAVAWIADGKLTGHVGAHLFVGEQPESL